MSLANRVGGIDGSDGGGAWAGQADDGFHLGVIAKTFPIAKVHEVLAATGTSSVRQRELPAHVMVYYVIALALFMNASYREALGCLLEGLLWLKDAPASIKATGKSGISQARSRLGDEAVRRPAMVRRWIGDRKRRRS